MNLIRRIWDRWKHPELYPYQRVRRDYLRSIDQARRITPEPYILSTVREVREA